MSTGTLLAIIIPIVVIIAVAAVAAIESYRTQPPGARRHRAVVPVARTVRRHDGVRQPAHRVRAARRARLRHRSGASRQAAAGRRRRRGRQRVRPRRRPRPVSDRAALRPPPAGGHRPRHRRRAFDPAARRTGGRTRRARDHRAGQPDRATRQGVGPRGAADRTRRQPGAASVRSRRGARLRSLDRLGHTRARSPATTRSSRRTSARPKSTTDDAATDVARRRSC